MKLHLPSPLRIALLACLAIAAPCTTLATATLVGAAMASYSAQAADIYYDGGTISSWENGTLMGDTAFQSGDNLIFSGSTNATLGNDITSGNIVIQSGGILTLDGDGHTLTFPYMNVYGLLRLKSQALAASSAISSTLTGVVEIAWGTDTPGNLASQLTGFSGTLRINASNYTLQATELQRNSQTLELLSGSTLQAANGTYVASVVSEGENTIQVASGTATFSGEVSGNGTLTKTGSGILALTTDIYHTGDLNITAGTVRFGMATQGSFNTLTFQSIHISGNGTFEDSHLGASMQHRTDVYLNGGTLTANDMYRPASGLRGITENYYRSLHVGEGTNSLNYTWKGGRRFGLLTSEVEGDGAPASVTLNIGNANEDTRTTFDRIVNFNGTIGGTAKNERNRIYIGAVDQADGYTMTISHNSHSKDLTKNGEGSLIITGTLSVENALTLQEGSLEVRGATTADDVTLTGGNLTAAALTADTYTLSGDATATHSGNVSTTASLSINTSGTVNLTNASSDGSVSIGGGTVTLSGNLTGLDSMSITGGATTAVNATAGDFSMSGGSLSLSGNMEVDSFRLTGGDLSLTGTGATGALTIHKELTMNYNGTLSYNSLRLDSGITLPYTAGAANLIQIPVSSGTYQNLEHISLNLLGLTGSQLYNNGINLGIAWAYKDTLDISTLSPSEYHLVNDNGYVVRKTYSSATTARTIWDRNWGNAVASAGPAEIKNVDWDIIGAKPGLYRSDYHTTSDKYDTCGIITGVPSTGYPAWADRAGSIIYGGAYGTARIDGSGGTVDRDVWLYAADGPITLLAGGSFEADANWNLGSASKEVDTHLLVSSGISTSGSFVAGNVRAVNTTSWTGDGYISVYSSNVTGSIVGGSVHTTQADEITATHTGNSTIYVYSPLSTNVNTRIWDTTRVDTANGLWDFIYGGLICGGSINSFASHTSEQTGDNFVTINLAGSGSSRSDMVKSIAGGHFGAGVQRQTGDTTVSILNTGGADFTGTAITAGHLAYVVDPDGDDASTPTATEQNQTGKGALTLPNTGNSDFTRLIGGHASIGATANPNQGRTGNTTISLTRVNGDVASITGGHYFTNNDDNDVTATQNQTGDMNITSSSLDVNGFLTGGHYNSATRNDFTNTNTATQNLTGSTNIRIDGGTYSGRVVAGHVFVDPDEDGRRGTYTGTITEGTHTTITGGTFGTVQGGSYIHANSNITNTSIGDVTMDLSGGPMTRSSVAMIFKPLPPVPHPLPLVTLPSPSPASGSMAPSMAAPC